jgi:hypothetical protein
MAGLRGFFMSTALVDRFILDDGVACDTLKLKKEKIKKCFLRFFNNGYS